MFITFEGLDGSGKSTQAVRLEDYLKGQGWKVLRTREPGGTPIGDQIREVLHSLDNTEMHPSTELLLYCASRAQLVEQVLRPHLQDGGVVICDRYADSTLAYQGYGHGLDLDLLGHLLHFATGGLVPDVTLYLDIAPEEGLQRRKGASLFGEEWNRMDNHEMAFYKRVQKGYRALIKADPDRWVKVKADQPIDKITEDIIKKLSKPLKQLS